MNTSADRRPVAWRIPSSTFLLRANPRAYTPATVAGEALFQIGSRWATDGCANGAACFPRLLTLRPRFTATAWSRSGPRKTTRQQGRRGLYPGRVIENLFETTAPTARTRRPFRYDTWFNNFDCPPQANFFASSRSIQQWALLRSGSSGPGGHFKFSCFPRLK
jgi:hypothetical protein